MPAGNNTGTPRTTDYLLNAYADTAPAYSSTRQLHRDEIVSTLGPLTDFGKLGTSPPLPGTQRFLPLPSVMASPPTVTEGTGGAASTIASAVQIAATVNSSGTYILNPLAPWRYLGGNPVVKAQTFPDRQYVTPNNANATNLTGSLSVEFEFDGSQFDFWMKGFTSSYRLNVDGALVTQYGTLGPPNNGNFYYINVNFTSRANRRIKIDFTASGCHFGGLNVGPNDTVWKSSYPIGARVIVMGDSFSDGSSATFRLAAYWDTLGKLMGWRDIWSSSIGATGYLTSTTFRSRVATDVIAFNPDIVIVAGGHNDVGTFTLAQVQTEATLLFQQIRAALPNAKIIAFSNFASNGSPSQNTLDIRDAIKNAINADTGPHLFVDSIVATVAGANTLGYATGTGRIGATTGSGNGDFYMSSDATHPSQAGHDYYARRYAADIAAAMPF